MASYGYTFTSGDTVTPTKLNNARTVSDIVNADISASAAIAYSKLNLANSIVAGDVTAGAITAAKVADGAVVQVVSATVSTVTAVSAVIPFDDTTPTSTEGAELLSATITPSSSTNKILVTFNGFCASPSTGFSASHVLFRGTTAINATSTSHSVANATTPVFIQHLDSPATASAVTYSMRVGPSVGTVNFAYNSNGGTRRYGGTAAAVLTLTEIKAS